MPHKITQLSRITTIFLIPALIVIGVILTVLPSAVHASGQIPIKAETRPARAVPTLKLTEAHADIAQFAEAGDAIEIQLLAEADAKTRWELQKYSLDTLAYQGERIVTDRHSRKKAPFKHVFLFRTTAAGRAVVSFVQQAETLTFIIEVR